ncbi:ABC transporter permease [Chloroflexi bacterium TSY]|nr:ABC transporter permease [Chloroflexi bacterium TSY]
MQHTSPLMEDASSVVLDLQSQFTEKGRTTAWSQILRFLRYSALGTVCLFILIGLVIVGIFAEQLMPYDPLEPDFALMKHAPSADHLLGTDHLGRDTLSRLILGTQATLLVAFSSVFLGVVLGSIWGIVSGYVGGTFDLISQRLVEVLMAFPFLILAMLLMAALRPGVGTVIIAIAAARIAPTSRTLRSIVLSIKEHDYVLAAQAIGASQRRILWYHVTPQTIALFLVILSMNVGGAVFAESALSFLGVGVPPPAPSWGNMLGGVLVQTFRPSWWLVIFPGAAISVTILALNLLGDTLRDFFDPTLRHR